MPEAVITDFTIKIDGAKLSDAEHSFVESIEWRTKYNSIPSCEIVFSNSQVDPYKWHGASLEVALKTGSEEIAKFKGEVVRLRHAYRGGGDYRFVLEARPKPWRMAMGAVHKSFLNEKTSDIVSKCVSDSGCSSSAESTSVQHKFVLQCNESNLSFVARLLEDEGQCFWVDDEENFKTSKAVTFAGAAISVTEDRLKSAFWEHRQAAEGVDVRGWFSGGEPMTDNGTAPKPESAISIGTILERSPSIAPQMQKPWKDGAIARIEGDRTLIHVTIVEPPALELGEKIDVPIMYGQSSDDSTTVSVGIVELSYRLNQDDGLTASVVGVDLGSSKSTKHLASTYLPPRSAPRPVLSGAFRAVVTSIEDPDRLGRIKVKFPTLDSETESWWAPYAQAMAGANRGTLLYPQVGDEVLVVFENGDSRFPVVIGSVYNSKDAPVEPECGPYQDGGDPYGTTIWDGQNELSFNSEDGKRAIFLQNTDATNLLVMATDDKTIVLESVDGVITIKAGTQAAIQLDANSGDITIECNNLNIKATADANIEGLNVNAKGSVAIALEGVQAELKGSAQTTVKGGMVMIN